MRPLHVLLLDRDAARRSALAAALRAAGHRVFDTPDPAVAAASLDPPEFDCLVLDLRLPELDLAALRGVLAPAVPAAPSSLEAAERLHIARTLAHTRGNRRRAALILGISRSTLLHKIRRYGIGEQPSAISHQPSADG